MKIAIDARWIFEELSGIGIYTRELIRNLADIDKENEYCLIFNNQSILNRTVQELDIYSKPNMTCKMVKYSLFSIRNQIEAPHFLKKENISLFHSTNYMIPLIAFPRRTSPDTFPKCVTTIHDLIPMVIANHAPRSKKTMLFPLYKELMHQVGKRSDAIITVSETSRKDVIEKISIPHDKIKSVYAIPNGVSPRFKPPDTDRSQTRCSADRPKKLLYVGRTDPYKNVTMLIEVLAELKKLDRFPVELLLASFPDPRYPEAGNRSRELEVADSVKWLGHLSDDQMVQAYQKADVLVHASEYEGFGLQVIEAMASGLPVVCSNGGSLPEVAGEAAIILEPHDKNGFVQAVTQILTDDKIYSSLIKKGQEQAARFTWRRTAGETLEVYKSVAETAANNQSSPVTRKKQGA